MKDFEALIGAWRGHGELPTDPPVTITADVKFEPLGEFIVFSSVNQPAAVPDSVAIIGGAAVGEPPPMYYFDARGIKRLYRTTLEASTWKIWLAPGEDWNGPHGPGFNQRFIGEISNDRRTIEARWERGLGPAGNAWEIDFPITYVRR